jgi:hypothetical protein
MSIYSQTIKTVAEVKTMTSHMTSLGKFMAVTEDSRLRDYIAHVVQALQYQYQNSTAKSTPTSLMFFPIPQTMQLIDYCKHQERLKKPEWQVVAEEHGWTPPQRKF